ncbi:phosphate uptake regulator PhoU (plasmid) [Haladaptatus sp. SPP-AMP-3]|uniref:PhoU domain-containing protein n=1 Tax=Haladaptatus sp. SPP-AMP-3 TaxID=3121295 RepID=UPI003C2E8D84
METRKVQITGGSTYTVSLPKGWATENEVSEGSALGIYPDEYTLILTPNHRNEALEGHLDGTGRSGDELVRTVIAMYVSGFDVITIETSRITADDRRAIRTATRTLAGFEVIKEGDRTFVVQVLFDSSQFSLTNAVERMHVIALEMLKDAIRALTDPDDALAQDVIDRDDDVDRLWFVVSRLFRKTLRTPAAVEELGIPREVCFDLFTGARQLERIADHAAKIGRVVVELDSVPEPVSASVVELLEEAERIIETATEALLADDRENAVRLANEARHAVSEVDRHGRAIDDHLRDLGPRQAQQLRLSIDSLSRCADYGGNIAEAALQKAAPRP